ncbi:MAG: 3-phosphoshikimate 1-carboxyvinyltransferase, partial [Kiritimatiellia bacterium]
MSGHVESALVHPTRLLGGILEVQGDKSISHRVAMLSGIATGESTVEHFLNSEDCVNTLKSMEALGARSFYTDEGGLKIYGTSGRLLEPVSALNLGNSGTGIRLMTGLVAGFPITVELTGDESLRSRPMMRIKEPLEKMGAKVELLGDGGCAPIRVRGGHLKAIEYKLPIASAQVKSCILLAALFAEGRTVIWEGMETRDHTERLLREAGIPVRVE